MPNTTELTKMRREEKALAALAATFFPAMPLEAASAEQAGEDESIIQYFLSQGDHFPGLASNVSQSSGGARCRTSITNSGQQTVGANEHGKHKKDY